MKLFNGRKPMKGRALNWAVTSKFHKHKPHIDI
jgi:hypothetical protein